MTPKPTLLLSPDGSFDRNGRVQPTITGGVRVVPGKYGNAWQIAEATTNLVENPSVEVDTSYWSYAIVAGGGSVARVPASLHGDYAYQITRNEVLGYTYAYSSVWGARPQTPHTFSLTVQCTKARRVQLEYVFWSGSSVLGNPLGPATTLVPDTPTRLELTATPPAGTDRVELRFRLIQPDNQEGVYLLDGMQYEEKPYATPYCDGSLGAGHAWTGTPHASTSTRANGGVSLTPAQSNVVPWMKGSTLLRTTLMSDAGEFMSLGYLWGTANAISIRSYDGTSYQLYLGTNGVLHYSPPSGIPLDTGPRTLYAEWDGEDIAISLDGGPKMYGTRVVPVDEPWETWGIRLQGHRWHNPESALFFDTALTEAEIVEYTNMQGAWTWNTTFGPGEVWAVPEIRSGLHLVETKIYESDMYGAIGKEITGEVITAGITSDIDRAGSKTHIALAAVGEADTLPSGLWVTPVQEIAREGLGVERVQRGVFELGEPSIETAGTLFSVANSGKDVVDRLARSALLDTFATPIGGHVMTDIELAIRMLGITSMGPNLIQNHGFEAGSAGGWHMWSPGPSWGVQWGIARTDYPSAPEGAVYLWTQPTSELVGTSDYTTVIQDVYFTAGSMQRAMFSALVSNTNGRTVPRLQISWFGGANNSEYINNIASETTKHASFTKWERLFVTGDVPPNATRAQCYISVAIMPPNTWTLGDFLGIDDVQFRAITGDLLPKSMLALPQSDAFATSRMQHLTSDPRLAAVNDRLAGIGMMAANATNDGKFTSRRSRDPARDAESRTYQIDTDIRMVGNVKTERAAANRYNRVFAIKEDTQAGTSMWAVAENTNRNDPWNIYDRVMAPKVINVRDAVDQAALQAIADAEITRASIQESITFQIMPDPTLTVYDIVRVDGPDGHPATGRWAIESIDSGLTATDPLLTIGARRTKVTD